MLSPPAPFPASQGPCISNHERRSSWDGKLAPFEYAWFHARSRELRKMRCGGPASHQMRCPFRPLVVSEEQASKQKPSGCHGGPLSEVGKDGTVEQRRCKRKLIL